MKIDPLVSVIIPLYNAENYILQTLESVKKQTFKNIELIVVDNASTDSSLTVVKEFSKNYESIKIITNDINSGGPAKPRNIGIEASQGEYIAFLDSDDLWHESKLEKQINLMINGNFNFTSTNSLLVNENSQPFNNNSRILGPGTKEYGIKSLLFRNTIITSSVVVNRDVLMGFRFDESENMVTSEDYHLWLTLMGGDNCRFVHLSQQLVDYRILANSLGHKNGKLGFATKGTFAATQFLVESNRSNLLYIILISNVMRLAKLIVTRKYH
jgi:teichuronic acid biosynthesis glycosyltransferase TuaG